MIIVFIALSMAVMWSLTWICRFSRIRNRTEAAKLAVEVEKLRSEHEVFLPAAPNYHYPVLPHSSDNYLETCHYDASVPNQDK